MARLTPLNAWFKTEAGAGVVLLGAAVLALVWANAPFGATYETFWHTQVPISLGELEPPKDLRHWINDGLMTLFFFVVGLEIKRELVIGELNTARKAMLPVIAAIGGMVGPAFVYLAFNFGRAGVEGWGIPMATDIAFAVGVLALLGDRIPAGLRIFVLSLAIVDDIGAIVIIAVFYSAGISVQWLLIAVALLVGITLLRRWDVSWLPIYIVVGTAVWLATLLSGVHATIAGVAVALLTPVRRLEPDEPAVAGRLQDLLHPWTSFVVIPLFALANAGVALQLGSDIEWRVIVGVAAGLVVGKMVGISFATWVAMKLRVGQMPEGMGWSHLIGAATVAGIGFTVSLFITTLAFTEVTLVDSAKIGVLIGSTFAGAMGAILLARSRPDR